MNLTKKTWNEILALAKTRGTWVTTDRLESIRTRANEIVLVPGAFIEMGVARGCSATVLAWLAAQQARHLILMDNFEGLPPSTDEDGDQAKSLTGHCKGELSDVRDFLEQAVPEVHPAFFVGDFEETAREIAGATPDGIALAHLDGDWYRSTKVALEHIGPRMSNGGVIIVDDYGWGPGCYQAVEEHLAKFPAEIQRVGPYQAWWTVTVAA